MARRTTGRNRGTRASAPSTKSVSRGQGQSALIANLPIPRPGPSPYAQLRSLTSAIVDRMDFANQAGLTYESPFTGQARRDLYEALGYKRKIKIKDYRDRYERGGIAERIIEAYPKATWGSGAEVNENDDPDISTPFEEQVLDLFTKLSLWEKLRRVDILSGLGRYAVLYLGADSSDLTQPLQGTGLDNLRYVTALAEDRAAINDFERDITNERYSLPLFYDLKFSAHDTKKVHWSRVIHVAEGLLEDDLYGKPRQRAVWNYLDDLDKVVGGGAEAAWKRMDPGMQVDIAPDVEMSKTAEDNLDAELDEYVHGVRRTLRTRGARVEVLSSSVAGFGTNVDPLIDLISATTGIPQRILKGSEMGELASSQDRNNWSDRIMERRKDFAEPLIRALINRLVESGILTVESDDYHVSWPEMDEMNEAEKATILSSFASANAAQKTAEGKIIITSDEMRDTLLDLEPLEDSVAIGIAEDEDTAEDLDSVGVPKTQSDENRGDLTLNTSDPTSSLSSHVCTATHLASSSAVVGRIAGVFTAMWQLASNKLDTRALEIAISSGDEGKAASIVFSALDLAESASRPHILSRLLAAFTEGAKLEIGTLRRNLSSLPEPDSLPDGHTIDTVGVLRVAALASIDLQFDKSNPSALQFARSRSSELITQVSNETREAVRVLIHQGMQSGIAPRKLTSLVREYIGLRTDQIDALTGFEQRLRNSLPGKIVEAGAGRIRVRIPTKGLSQARVSSLLDRYEAKLRRDRALLIARCETARSANEGQRELWLQAVEEDLLPADQKRRWVTNLDGKERQDHHDMHRQVRGLKEKFLSPSGARIEPGEEPNCRCGQELKF